MPAHPPTPPLRDASQRLLSLLHGRPAPTPYWEPWFAMRGTLHERYAGSYLAMADDLGHAAIPMPPLELGTVLVRRANPEQTGGAWYEGGALQDLSQLRDAPEPDYNAIREKLTHARRRRAADAGIACWAILPWCFHAVATSMGLENFAMTLYDEPDFIREAMAWVENRNRLGIERILADVQPDFVLYDGDCAYKTGTMIDPALMRSLTQDITRPNIQRLRQLGIPAAFHSDGKLDDVIPLVRDIGFSAIHGCEAQANQLDHLVERFGDDIALCGNMDVVFLSQANPDQVREATEEMLRVGGRKGRFIAGCNTSPQDYIPFENYATFVRTVTQPEA